MSNYNRYNSELENERNTHMQPETMASLNKKLRANIHNPHEVAAIAKFIRAKNRLYNDEQVYALRFWYEQLHLLDRDAPRASLLSAEEIVDILIDRMTTSEFHILNERLLLIRDHYPEKVRWHKKMEEGLGGGYGLKAQVMGSAYPGGPKFLSVEWLKATEEEKGFQWWW